MSKKRRSNARAKAKVETGQQIARDSVKQKKLLNTNRATRASGRARGRTAARLMIEGTRQKNQTTDSNN